MSRDGSQSTDANRKGLSDGACNNWRAGVRDILEIVGAGIGMVALIFGAVSAMIFPFILGAWALQWIFS